MTFLPPDAQEPKSKSNYTMPLTEGRHKLRVISSAIVGYEGWQDDGQKRIPIRWKVGEQPEYGPDGKETKYFWAFLCWNYAMERIQIMCVTQKKIRNQIKALLDDEDWGSVLEYNIVITREGKDMNDTVYTVMPNQKTPLDPIITQQLKEKNIDLNAWMRGEDPFAASTANSAPKPQESQNLPSGEAIDGQAEVILAEFPSAVEEPVGDLTEKVAAWKTRGAGKVINEPAEQAQIV